MGLPCDSAQIRAYFKEVLNCPKGKIRFQINREIKQVFAQAR